MIVGLLALLPTCGAAQMVPWRAMSMPAPMAYVEEFAPPPIYRTWYADMQACSGVRGPAIETIHFYAVDGDTFLMQGSRVIGWGDKDNRTIWLARWGVGIQRLVSHELLHILLGAGHPGIPWKFPCGV